MINEIKAKILLKKLKSNGDLIYAEFSEVKSDKSYYIGHQCQYNIYCKWISPYDGKEYVFKSPSIWDDPTEMIELKNIQSFPVYISKDKINPYIMDLEILNYSIFDDSDSR